MVEAYNEISLAKTTEKSNQKEIKKLTLDILKSKEKVLNWVLQFNNKKFEKFSRWIIAGSGNYEITKNNGRYRESCNTYRGAKTCEEHKIKSLKPILNRCNKLDCETCYITSSSLKAVRISDMLLKFKGEAERLGIRVGHIKHIVLSFKQIFRFALTNYEKFKILRKRVYEMLEDCGIVGGYLFTHMWSGKCDHCGIDANRCICDDNDKDFNLRVNAHFHVLGFGYLPPVKEFRTKYPNWVYQNHGSRKKKEVFNTAFYIISHSAMWRKPDGKLMPSSLPFGWMRRNKFTPIRKWIELKADKCKHCGKILKRVDGGVKAFGDRPQVNGNITLKAKAKYLGIETKGRAEGAIKNDLDQCVVINKNFRLHACETDMILGKNIEYKEVTKKYEIRKIGELREKILNNRRKFVRDRQNESNGYG